MSDQPTILCILEPEQRAEYAAELEDLTRRGVELIHQEDPDEALEQVGSLDPRMVMVGMEVGPTEGLEFLALVLSRYPKLERPVVVLPRKGDPFPPVCHRRDPQTGRSTADEVGFEQIAAIVVGPAAPPMEAAAPVARESHPTPVVPEPAVAPGQPAGQAPVAEQPGGLAPASDLLAPTSQARGLPRWVPLAVVVAVVVVGGVVAAVMLGGGEEPGEGSGSGVAKVEPKAEPDSAPGGVAQAEPDAAPPEVAKPKPDAAKPAPKVDLSRPVVLPLAFGKASSRPDVAQAAKLAEVVTFLRANPSVRVEVAGHASTEGDDRFNDELGAQRARAVVDLLASRGIARGRMTAKSYGGRQPIASNQTEDGRTKNRRVTIKALP